MRLRPPLRVSVTRHEEKEQKLQEFICQHLSGPRPGDSGPAFPLMIIARSLDSPVVKAVAGLADEIAAAGLPARMIPILACAAARTTPVTYADLKWADYGA